MSTKDQGSPEHYRATLVSHTHWDRAWYVPFQEYRIRLVRLVDRLIDLLNSNPDFLFYMLDGQMSVLEDYLSVRPHRAHELQALCRTGRIQVGPWFVLADEFLVSPEALIRNLMLGHRMGERYGGVMKEGYVPDGFGHIAQLPQILRGFGIESAFFWRGMGAEGDALGSEFRWIAPDGSSVTAILMPYGYHNVSNLGYAIHWGDTSQMDFDLGLALTKIRKAVQRLKPFANSSALLLMNGIDHAEPEPRIPEIIAACMAHETEFELSHGLLSDHLAHVRSSGVLLPSFQGEFRWGRYSEILQGVYATRINLKQANHDVEILLERYVDPLTAFAWLGGGDVPKGTADLIWSAWRYLLRSQAHDDIYGAGVDKTHRETAYRFEQARQIGEVLARDMLRLLARQADCSQQPGMPFLVFNPLNHDRHEIAQGDLEFDVNDPAASDFSIIDASGQVIPHQVIDNQELFWMEVLKSNRKRRVRVAVELAVPACGYRVYFAVPRRRQEDVSRKGVFEVHPRGAENRFTAFSITEDGLLDVTDKRTGHRYSGIHLFEDIEDAGDEYSYARCAESETVTSRGAACKVEHIHDGPCFTTFRISQTLVLPRGLTMARQRRSTTTVDVPVTSELTLLRDQPAIYIETSVENRAEDHKLAVVFPTGIATSHVHVDESFMVAERAIDLPPSEGWVEDPTSLMHQRSFVDVSLGGRGLAILNRGLPAVEIVRQEDQTVSVHLVLLRAVGWLARADLSTRRCAAGPIVETPEAQCLGVHRFQYAVLPHAGDWRSVYRDALDFTTPLRIARADTHEGLELADMNITGDDPKRVRAIPWPRGGPNPAELSFLKVEPEELILSALRRNAGGDGIIVRFYNVLPEDVTARIITRNKVLQAWLVNMNEERLESLAISNGNIMEISVGKAQVITVELIPQLDTVTDL